MIVCSNCGRKIVDDSAFCPYCGSTVTNDLPTPACNTEIIEKADSSPKKKISKKTIAVGILAAVVINIIGIILICEYKIDKAKRLYAQSEYWEAYHEIWHIPILGREELIRIETAAYAGYYYENYLTTKRIRLSSTSNKYKDAYQEAFFDLIFGLYIDIKDINSESNSFNDIQLDEYQKFIDLSYSELSSMFHMSKPEADELVERIKGLDGVDEIKAAANEWLDEYFFDGIFVLP